MISLKHHWIALVVATATVPLLSVSSYGDDPVPEETEAAIQPAVVQSDLVTAQSSSAADDGIIRISDLNTNSYASCAPPAAPASAGCDVGGCNTADGCGQRERNRSRGCRDGSCRPLRQPRFYTAGDLCDRVRLNRSEVCWYDQCGRKIFKPGTLRGNAQGLWRSEWDLFYLRNRMQSDAFRQHMGRVFGYFIPSGCCGNGCPPYGVYKMVYAENPYHFDPRDGKVYGAQGTGVPMSVPLAPVVNSQFNYSHGIPASRNTPISNVIR